MVEGLAAARGIDVTYETVRRWSVKFGLGIARPIRSSALARGDKWYLDEVVVTINGRRHWLWRAVDGSVVDAHAHEGADGRGTGCVLRMLDCVFHGTLAMRISYACRVGDDSVMLNLSAILCARRLKNA